MSRRSLAVEADRYDDDKVSNCSTSILLTSSTKSNDSAHSCCLWKEMHTYCIVPYSRVAPSLVTFGDIIVFPRSIFFAKVVFTFADFLSVVAGVQYR